MSYKEHLSKITKLNQEIMIQNLLSQAITCVDVVFHGRYFYQAVPIFKDDEKLCAQLTAMLTMRRFGAVCMRLFLYTVQMNRVLPSKAKPSNSNIPRS